jgi:hypothetical protein
VANTPSQIKKTEMIFQDKTLPTEKRHGGVPDSERVCTVCMRPIWHQQRRGPYARNCGAVCMLTRRFLGGNRTPEATWEIMRSKRLCTWKTLEEFWRDMGATYFDGAFFVRRNRAMPHGPDNSAWVNYFEARKIQALLARKARDAKPTSTGVPIGDIAAKFGTYTFLFQRICGSIAKRYNVPIDVVYADFASVPPPTANWAQEIRIYHQGQEYSLDVIAKEAKVSILGLYYRWMKGMYVIDDDMAYRLQQQRSKYSGTNKNNPHTWKTGEFQ